MNERESSLSISALRKAIINACELGGVFGQNINASKEVLLRVDGESYPLGEVSVGFYAGTGQFVMYLDAKGDKETVSSATYEKVYDALTSTLGITRRDAAAALNAIEDAGVVFRERVKEIR